MPTYKITAPDGTVYRVTGEGTEQEALSQLQAQLAKDDDSGGGGLLQGVGDTVAGLARGAGSIGATLLAPLDAATRAVTGGKPVSVGGVDVLGRDDRRQAMDEGLTSMGANPESWPFFLGKMGAEIAGTGGAGSALGAGAARIGLPGLAAALESGGLAGTSLLNRVAGGGLSGAAAGGLVDPSAAGVVTGAAVGGALGGVAQRGANILNELSPARRQLALEAEAQGVRVPVDRILENRVLDRVAGPLEYVPFSGRGKVLRDMEEQIRTAANATMGQVGTADVRGSVRQARQALGPEFDRITASVNIGDSPRLRQELTDQADRIRRAVPSSDAEPLLQQIRYFEDHLDTGGYLPGEAALAMKTDLDEVSGAGGVVGARARDLRRVLLDEIRQELGPTEAAAYERMRRQWSNMLRMEKLQTHDPEGAISMARFGNMPQRNTSGDLNRLADMAYTFAKARDAPHSLQQQNVLLGLGGAGAGIAGYGIPALAALATARGTNSLLSSDWLRRMILNQPQQGAIGPAILGLREGAYRFAPGAVVSGSQN